MWKNVEAKIKEDYYGFVVNDYCLLFKKDCILSIDYNDNKHMAILHSNLKEGKSITISGDELDFYVKFI